MLGRICRRRDFQLPEVRINTAFGWTLVCTPQDYAWLQSAVGREPTEEMLTKPETHWGGTLVPRSVAIAVAGFGECYYGWGLEDDDFHWKLRASHQARPILSRELIHFEHPRGYKSAYLRNKSTYDARVAQGFSATRDSDRNNPNSLFASWLRGSSTELGRYLELASQTIS